MRKNVVDRRLVAGVTMLTALLCAGVLAPAYAHHSFAMYDQNQTKTLTGRLTRYIPGANHAQLIFEVLGPDGMPQIGKDGKPVQWGVETGSAAAPIPRISRPASPSTSAATGCTRPTSIPLCRRPTDLASPSIATLLFPPISG